MLEQAFNDFTQACIMRFLANAVDNNVIRDILNPLNALQDLREGMLKNLTGARYAKIQPLNFGISSARPVCVLNMVIYLLDSDKTS